MNNYLEASILVRDTDERLVQNLSNLPATFLFIDSRQESTKPVSTSSGLDFSRLVERSGLDLIKVADGVYKLIDYGRYRFDEQKRQKETARKQREKARTMKEYFFSLVIGDHDYQVKLKQIREHLEDHDIRVGVKYNKKTKNTLPRGLSLKDTARRPDFILRRVLSDLDSPDTTRTDIQMGDRMVSATIKRKAAQ